jgi:1-acyl-sn-glycerol-3-phosphate acyltransferase
MNRQPYQKPPRWWPPKMTPWMVRLTRYWRLRTLRRQQRLVRIDVQGLEPVRQALQEGAGMLITPNHSFHYDSYVLMEAAHLLGRPFHFLSAWQVFAMSSRFDRWLMQKHGCFSIDRESTDLQALKKAIEILRDSPYPLVVFPEGDIYHTNDRVTPFREGASSMAFSAAKQAQRKVVCVPCALKCWYIEDPTPTLGQAMRRLEEQLLLRPRPNLSLPERLYRFSGAVLALKEMEYLGTAQVGELPERVAHLADSVLKRLEERYGITRRAELVPERVKEVRRRIIPKLEKPDLSADERQQLGEDMEDLFFIIQLFSYPGDYVAEKPSIERVAETLDKFEEDALRLTYPSIHATRRTVVRFGEPIEVPRERDRKEAVSQWTTMLEEKVQALLDQLNTEAEKGSFS